MLLPLHQNLEAIFAQTISANAIGTANVNEAIVTAQSIPANALGTASLAAAFIAGTGIVRQLWRWIAIRLGM